MSNVKFRDTIYAQRNIDTWILFLSKLYFISDECTQYVIKLSVMNCMRQNKFYITSDNDEELTVTFAS